MRFRWCELFSINFKLISIIALLFPGSVLADEILSIYPKTISEDCFAGRALSYDECGLQSEILHSALREANKTDKTVLVVFGAEWCIWCHVFKEHIKGKFGEFNYKLEGQAGYNLNEKHTDQDILNANDLRQYAAKTFVVANIEAQYSFDGYDVLYESGAEKYIKDTIPFIFTTDRNGQFLREMPSTHELKSLEKKRDGVDWYRGYNRKVLLSELKRLIN